MDEFFYNLAVGKAFLKYDSKSRNNLRKDKLNNVKKICDLKIPGHIKNKWKTSTIFANILSGQEFPTT